MSDEAPPPPVEGLLAAADVRESNLSAYGSGHAGSIAQQREDARSFLAKAIVFCLLLIVAAGFPAVWFLATPKAAAAIKLIQVLIGPVAGIVGAVTGFYFGANRAKDG